MDHILRDAVEIRRQNIIKKLITFDVYKIEHKHLFELTLTELENEYKNMMNSAHPHNGFNSFQFVTSDKCEEL